MLNAAGGSEWRAIRLFEKLAEVTDVTLWSYAKPSPDLLGRVPIRFLDPALGAVPRQGNVILVGSYLHLNPWLERCQADRYIVLHNVDEPENLRRTLDRLAELDKSPVEVVYASSRLRDRSGGPPGEVHPSPIDLEQFKPTVRPERPFTVGRLSRDDWTKHHPEEPAFYRRLASEGIRVRVMGGLSLRDSIGEAEGIELLPANAEPPETFLASLDAFYFRTHPDWFEAWGRVISEAMATGLPIVAESRHGYVDFVAGGVLFDSLDEAYQALSTLRDDPGLRQKLGSEGRVKAEESFGEEAIQRQLETYLR